VLAKATSPPPPRPCVHPSSLSLDQSYKFGLTAYSLVVRLSGSWLVSHEQAILLVLALNVGPLHAGLQPQVCSLPRLVAAALCALPRRTCCNIPLHGPNKKMACALVPDSGGGGPKLQS